MTARRSHPSTCPSDEYIVAVPDASTFAAFAVASLALLVIPGPAVLYIVNRSVSDGRTVGLAAVAGLELGNLMHALAAAVGLSAVLATSATAFNAVKWLGAAYLIVVGVRTLLRRPQVITTDRAAISHRRAFGQGVVVNVLNPKVALFFLSFLPQFIDPDVGGSGRQALALGIVFVLIGCITDSLYSLLSSGLRCVLVGGRGLPFVQRYVAGTVFIGLGVVAATASAGNHTSVSRSR
jgi:threonine/homoserine/homoserine lactone efflux protein